MSERKFTKKLQHKLCIVEEIKKTRFFFFKYKVLKCKCSVCGYEFTTNGIGPKGKWFSKYFKLFPFLLKYNDAANKHDIGYERGCTKKD